MEHNPDITSPTLICFRFSFRFETSDFHFYDLYSSSCRVIYLLPSIYMWTLTLLTAESFSAIFVIYFMQSAGLCPDSRWRQTKKALVLNVLMKERRKRSEA